VLFFFQDGNPPSDVGKRDSTIGTVECSSTKSSRVYSGEV
jgi:hypothetical protein